MSSKQNRLDNNNTWITPKKASFKQEEHPIVTPEGSEHNAHWHNRYGFLDQPLSDEDDSSVGTNTTDPDSESEDEYEEEDNMSTDKYESLEDKLEITIKPKISPTMLDVLRFKQELIIGLTKCAIVGKRQGHAYLVETIEEYRIRSKNPKAVAIERPTEPIPPTVEDRKKDKYARSDYKDKVKEYDLCNKYDEQALELIKKAFPGSLDDLRIRGYLPTELTAKEALDHVRKQAQTSIASRKCYLEIYNRFGAGGRTYKPNANGPRDFFTECEEDLRLAEELGVKEVDVEQLMISAQEAFWRSGHDTNKLREYETEWAAMKRLHSSVLQDPYEVYTKFKSYYTLKLKNLYVDTTKNRKGRAYMTETEEASIERLAKIEANVAELCNTQLELAEQMSAYRTNTISQPPSVIVPTGNSIAASSIESSTAYQALLSKYQALEAKVEANEQEKRHGGSTDSNRNNGRPNSRHKKGNQNRRQLKYYCPTCGVNTSHFAATCRYPDEKHADRMNATRLDPQGGHTGNNHYWLKWIDREKNVYNDRVGGNAVGKLN